MLAMCCVCCISSDEQHLTCLLSAPSLGWFSLSRVDWRVLVFTAARTGLLHPLCTGMAWLGSEADKCLAMALWAVVRTALPPMMHLLVFYQTVAQLWYTFAMCVAQGCPVWACDVAE